MKKIFITGGFGFIGSELAKKALLKGFSVFLYDSLSYEQDLNKLLKDIESKKSKESKLEWVIGDTRNNDLLAVSLKKFKPDFLFHFAELVGVYACDHNPSYTKAINFDASKSVIDVAEKLEIPVIYNSTSSLYGNQKDSKLLDEKSPLPETSDNYCKYKLRMEKYIKSRMKANPEFKAIILRPATVWGVSPRMRLDLLPNHFTYCAVAKGIIKISGPDGYRAEMDIDDIVDSYFKIMEKKIWPKLIYNIGHHNLSKMEVVKAIQSITNCKIETIPDLGDRRNLQIDSLAFYEDFDFAPKHSFEDSVKNMTIWIKKNKKEIEGTNYNGIINTSLDRWLKMI